MKLLGERFPLLRRRKKRADMCKEICDVFLAKQVNGTECHKRLCIANLMIMSHSFQRKNDTRLPKDCELGECAGAGTRDDNVRESVEIRKLVGNKRTSKIPSMRTRKLFPRTGQVDDIGEVKEFVEDALDLFIETQCTLASAHDEYDGAAAGKTGDTDTGIPGASLKKGANGISGLHRLSAKRYGKPIHGEA